MTRIVTVVALFLAISIASATDLNSGGFIGVHRVVSSVPLGQGGVNIGGTIRYGRDWNYISSGSMILEKSPQLFEGNLFAGVGVGMNWDIALHLPFHADIPGWDVGTTAGVGDLAIATKMTLPVRVEEAVVTAALLFELTTPTGSSSSGMFTRYPYFQTTEIYSGGRVYYAPSAAMTIHFDRSRTGHPLRLHFNVGSVLSNVSAMNSATAGMALELFPTEWLTLFTETYGTIRYESLYWEQFYRHLNNGQIWIAPGARFTLNNGVSFTLSGDLGVAESNSASHRYFSRNDVTFMAKENPQYAVKLTVNWQKPSGPKDRDGDGVIDSEDRCPDHPEDFDGFEDLDGCPDYDNDGDGFADSVDTCPVDAEDFDGFEDDDGCPDRDNDRDGVADVDDSCPNEPEDLDGFEDLDGCPDFDNDGDGIPDSLDSCPDDPEDFDGFEDHDGCPDYDNDGDGVADSVDNCPSVVGTIRGKGCPEAVEISRDGLVLKGVNFALGKAVLQPESFPVLDEVAESLLAWPEVTVEVQGHTDASGSRSGNIRISQQRAETVARYLLSRGIERSRITVRGYGPDRPVASNSTAAGRSENRRVELKRTDHLR